MSTKAQVEACYIYADRLLSRGLRPNQIVHLMSECNMTEVWDAFWVLCAMLVCLSIMAVPVYVMQRAMNPVPDDPAPLEDLSGANDFVVIKTFEQQDFADTLSFSLESEGFLTETKATEMGWELSVPSAQEARAREYLTVIERGIEDL